MDEAKKGEPKQEHPLEETTLERFLAAVADKTNDPAHLRLLKACRIALPGPALEAELQAIVKEILNETPTP